MKKKIEKVLIFIPSFTYGGGEKHGILVARLLKDIGYEVHIWAYFKTSSLSKLHIEELRSEGFICKIIDTRFNINTDFYDERNPYIRVKKFILNYFLPKFIMQLKLPKDKFDILIPFTFYPCLLTVLFKKKLKANLVLWNHLGGNDSAGISYNIFLTRIIRKAKPIFCTNSKGGAEFLKNTFDKSYNDIYVIHNIYIPESFENQKRVKRVLKENQINLLQIANFFPEKDLLTLLKGISILKESNFNCHLYLVGSFMNKSDNDAFEKQLIKLDITDFVTYLGSMEREKIYNELIDKIDIGILSSRSEGMPNSIMEMMYWGLPIVASNIIGIYELVGDKYDCLFEIGNPDDFAKKIKDISSDKNKRIEIGQYNKRRIETHFSKEMILPKWLELIDNAGNYL